jgi:hypothetical protein
LYVLYRILHISWHTVWSSYKNSLRISIHSNRHVMCSSWNVVSWLLWNSLAADTIIVDKQINYIYHAFFRQGLQVNYVCLFSWRHNPLWLYFPQPGSGL